MTLEHKRIALGDGHRVGVTIGGAGLPLVFCHGFTVNRRLYSRMLERIARSGFQVVAIDMAGHGDTDALPCGHTFADMVDLTARALDALGVDRAVMVGHSLGGRMVAEFSAAYPERVIHAVLMNAAVGRDFDELDVTPVNLATLPARLTAAAADFAGDTPWHEPRKALRYLRELAGAVLSSASGLVNVALATKDPSPSTADTLDRMRHNLVPTNVIHSVWDLIVPFHNGAEAAKRTEGELVALPGFHNWIVVHPIKAANIVIDALTVNRVEADYVA